MADADRHDELVELLVPYSLGDLDAATTARVERALDEDETLRRELDAIEQAGARMLGALPRHAAPAALRGRVMDAVGAARRHDLTGEAEASPIGDLSHRRARRERFRRSWALPAASAALAVACTVLALLVVDLRSDLDVAQERLAGAREDSSASPFTRAVSREVQTSDALEQARGSLIDVGDEYLLVIENLPRPKPGTSWQVWTADSSGTIRNVAQWTSDEQVQLLVIDEADVTEVMISHERATHAVPAPTSAPIANVRV